MEPHEGGMAPKTEASEEVRKREKPLPSFRMVAVVSFLQVRASELLTESESLDYGTVAVDVLLLEVREETTALTYELHEGAVCGVVLVVGLNVLCEMLDTISEKCNLALARTCVCSRGTILCEDLCLLC